MRVPDPLLPQNPDTPYARELNFRLVSILRSIANKVNALGSTQAAGIDNAATAAPTTGTHAVGDFIKNSAPAEAGSAGSKYVITGWLCTSGGTPGTFVQVRALTGN